MNNKYEVFGDYAIVYMGTTEKTKSETIVDLDGLKKMIDSHYSWHRSVSGGYACAQLPPREGTNKLFLHRFLMEPQRHEEVDHINGNKMDNRFSNLRAVSKTINLQNRHRANSNNKTGVRGVSYNKASRKYSVNLNVDKKVLYFGRYDTVEEATRIAEKARAEHMPGSKEAMRG